MLVSLQTMARLFISHSSWNNDKAVEVRDWLADTATRSDRRVAVLSQTMSGVLDTFKSRIPAMAAHVEAQVVLRAELRRTAEASYERAFAEANASIVTKP